MPEIQVSDKNGDAILVLRAGTVEEFDALTSSVLESENPILRRFELASDTAKAAAKIAAGFQGSSVGPENPLCTSCGGTTTEKTTKQGKTYWACNQDRGECKNEKGYATSVWSRNAPKGRDS